MKKLIVILIFTSLFVPMQAFGHVEEENEVIILSRYFPGNLPNIPDPESGKWEQSYETEIESEWEHEVFLKSLNNGTHTNFLLSWNDITVDEELFSSDGAALIFENTEGHDHENNDEPNSSKSEQKEIWVWDASSKDVIVTDQFSSYSQWNDGNWNVIFERKIGTGDIDKSVLIPGVKQEGLIKLVVWDATKGESFELIDDEELEHSDFILLPEIEIYPKDVFVWLTLLLAVAFSFVMVERQLHTKMEKIQ